MADLNNEGRYTDLPHTLFPQASDDEAGHPLMSNISGDLFAAAKEYSTKVAQGDALGAQTVLQNNPGLVNTMFTADKYNWMRDAIVATQRYYASDVRQMITEMAQHSIGLDDNNTLNAPDVNGYSITKITSMVRGTPTQVTLEQSNWQSNDYIYQYQIQINGITANDDIDIGLIPFSTISEAKAWSKAMVLSATQTTNLITLRSYGKVPQQDIRIIVNVHK